MRESDGATDQMLHSLYLLTAETAFDRFRLDQLGAERTFLHIARSYSVFFNSGPVRRCDERQNEPEWAQW